MSYNNTRQSRKEITRKYAVKRWAVQWLRLALFKGPYRVGISPSSEDGNRYRFRNFVFSSYLDFRTMDKALKPSESSSSLVCTVQTVYSDRHFIADGYKKKLHGLSPRANYTDRATAACRRSDFQLLRIKVATWSAWRIPTAVFSVS
jgi:hypothetical protein